MDGCGEHFRPHIHICQWRVSHAIWALEKPEKHPILRQLHTITVSYVTLCVLLFCVVGLLVWSCLNWLPWAEPPIQQSVTKPCWRNWKMAIEWSVQITVHLPCRLQNNSCWWLHIEVSVPFFIYHIIGCSFRVLSSSNCLVFQVRIDAKMLAIKSG